MQDRRGYALVGLERPKNPANVGLVMRSAGCFGAVSVYVAQSRLKGNFEKSDAQKAHRHMPLTFVDDLRPVLPVECVPIGVELTDGARSLVDFIHPERALYVFGPEDGDLSPETIAWCDAVIRVPTIHCLNLASCVTVVLYDRVSKRGLP